MSLQNTLDAARAAAQNNAPTALVPANEGSYAPPATQNAGPPRSMREMANAQGVTPTSWISLTKDVGFRLVKLGDVHEEFTFGLDFSKVVPITVVRYNVAGKVTYARTADGVTSRDGKPWAQVMRQAYASDSVSDYLSCEVPFVLLSDYKDKKANKTLSAGAIIGYTPSMMNAKEFTTFFNGLPLDIEAQGVVKVHVNFEVRQGQEPYGALTYSLVQ